uniref:Histone H3.v1-like isoform X4 n=1 Tax=Nicotiana sylvestris TaxID=4096 RepID=A0A1U7XG54_NICSY|nr:PREDICTED: histone H3.v1-like isoform X4 [Nicotiana sylvestris]
MHGYERDEYEELDEYEEEGEEQEEDEEGEEEYEEEEPQQPPQELLEYLELRQRLKEDIRKQRKKELGSVNGRSTEIKKALPRDNYGSFFGPSQPVIPQRVIQESKLLLENPNLAAKVLKSNHALKTKVQMLKSTRDYSFLLSDDAELPASIKRFFGDVEDARLSLPPSSKQSLSNTRRKLLNDREVRKPIPGSSQMQPKLLTQKSVSVSKQSQLALDLRKQLSSSKGSGPDRPLRPKVVPPKVIGVPNGKRVSTPGVKSTVPALHKPTPSKLQPSIPRQSLAQKKELLQSGKSKGISNQAVPSSKSKRMMQKQAMPSSKSQIKQLPPKSAIRSLEDRCPARKPMRHDEEGDGAEAISMIRRMFGYNPNRYQDDDDTLIWRLILMTY